MINRKLNLRYFFRYSPFKNKFKELKIQPLLIKS
jgi:hypothetical protein